MKVIKDGTDGTAVDIIPNKVPLHAPLPVLLLIAHTYIYMYILEADLKGHKKHILNIILVVG